MVIKSSDINANSGLCSPSATTSRRIYRRKIHLHFPCSLHSLLQRLLLATLSKYATVVKFCSLPLTNNQSIKTQNSSSSPHSTLSLLSENMYTCNMTVTQIKFWILPDKELKLVDTSLPWWHRTGKAVLYLPVWTQPVLCSTRLCLDLSSQWWGNAVWMTFPAPLLTGTGRRSRGATSQVGATARQELSLQPCQKHPSILGKNVMKEVLMGKELLENRKRAPLNLPCHLSFVPFTSGKEIALSTHGRGF